MCLSKQGYEGKRAGGVVPVAFTPPTVSIALFPDPSDDRWQRILVTAKPPCCRTEWHCLYALLPTFSELTPPRSISIRLAYIVDMVNAVDDVTSGIYPAVDGQTVRSTLTAGIISVTLESIAFGTLVVAYTICGWTLLHRHRAETPARSRRHLALLSASTAMFMLAFIHEAIDIHIILSSFLMEHYNLFTIAVQLDGLDAVTSAVGAAKFAIYVTQLLIGDGIMIYRAYVVWDRSFKVIIPPFILLAGELVLGYFVSLAGPFAPEAWGLNIAVLSNAFFVISVVTNILSSGLIMARILWFTSRTQKVFRVSLDSQDGRLKNVTWRVLESILQSAAIYSVASISLAVTSFTSTTSAFPACHSVFPSVIGLVFLLIAMRISSSATASKHRSMLSTTGASALSLSSTLACRFAEGTGSSIRGHAHSHGKSEGEGDVERGGGHVHARSGRERERTERTERRLRVGSPIAIHVSVCTTSRSDSDYYESVDVLSPRTPPSASCEETRLSLAASLDMDICEAEEYAVWYPELQSTSEEWSAEAL
ncbi:hypothetical protein GSI_12073 [Ganoderma sinense ZZ0214-1]|uniref:Uncharacterized protein n=1 Tax=Ganoderma sinense ZZ0214-1 TaxID=1077348 RepID=A0A2G8RXV3_9APHY|nr:hypothetical protein GSI_12073 [Ganoderma sinense ZZ0214-1]